VPTPTTPAAIVFDLDGTLVDTVEARIEAWAETFAEHSIPVTREQLEPMIGMDGRRLAREVAAAADRPLGDQEADDLDRRAGELFDERNTEPRPLPGSAALLERLDARGITWAIATSSRAEQVSRSVEALRLPRAPRIVDGSRVEHAKPAPDLLLLAAREMDASPEATWYVGDSTWDMQAAVAARMPGIAVLAGAAVDATALWDAGAELVIETLAQLDVGT
jgi:HAD superfamily hydrolase (TIGR01509 family)